MDKVNVLIDEKTVEKRIEEIAEEIMKDYERKKLTFICILKGSAFFTVELAKRITNNVELEFIRVASYGRGKESSGKIEMLLGLKESIEGKDVIVIEDIIDTGHTLSYLLEYLESKNPKTLKLCALLDKVERREVDIKVDYVGFEIPNKFIVRIWTRL